jgi:H3 lysine-79-specific histone-lysine N-methyltransferase
MNLFKKSKKFSIPPATPTIRLERVPEVKKPAPIPSRVASTKLMQSQRSEEGSPSRASSSTPRSSPATPTSDSPSSSRLKPGKRKASRQKSPTQQVFDEDSEDDGTVEELEDTSYKRQKTSRTIDFKRQLRSKQAFSEANGGVFEMIHAADISSLSKKSKLAIAVSADIVTVELQYPSASQRERCVMEKTPPTNTNADV